MSATETATVVAETSKTDQILAVILEKALAAAEKTGQFVVEQAPDVVQQLIVYNLVISGLASLLGLVLTLTLFKTIPACLKWGPIMDDYRHKEHEGAIIKFLLNFGAALVCVSAGPLFFFENIGNFLKLVLAPKVWLLEYAANLIR